MLAGVLLLPVYTRCMSVADYGAVDLINQTNGIFRILFVSTFTYSVSRFFHSAPTRDEQRQAISTATIAVIVVAVVAAIVCAGFDTPLAQFVFGDLQYSRLVRIGSVLLLLDLTFLGLSFQYLVEKKSTTFVVLNLIKLVTAIAANLLFIVVLRMGAVGMLYGNIVSYVVVCTIAFTSCVRAYGFSVNTSMLAGMIRFGAPMVPAMFLATVMHNGDRFLLRPLGSLEQVGMFTVGMQFPAMLNAALLTSFNSIWGGATMFQISQQSDGDYQISKIATLFMLAYMLCQTSLGIFASTLLLVLVDPKFFPARDVILIACVGYSFHAMYTFLTTKAFTQGTPARMIAAYGIAVCVKCALSIFTVSTFGYIASAWVFATSYLVFSVSCYVLFRRSANTRFDWQRLGTVFAACIVGLGVSRVLQFQDPFVTVVSQICVYAALLAFFWFGPFFSESERNALHAEFTRLAGGLASRYRRVLKKNGRDSYVSIDNR